MRNPIFKAQVAALFEKTANGRVQRGHEIIEGARDVASTTGNLLGAGYRGLSKLVDPAGAPGFVSRGVAGAGAGRSYDSTAPMGAPLNEKPGVDPG